MTTIREILKNITNEDFLYCKEQSNCNKDEFIRLLLIKIDEKYEEECWTCGVLPAKNETYRDSLGEIEYTCDSCHSKEYEEEEEEDQCEVCDTKTKTTIKTYGCMDMIVCKNCEEEEEEELDMSYTSIP